MPQLLALIAVVFDVVVIKIFASLVEKWFFSADRKFPSYRLTLKTFLYSDWAGLQRERRHVRCVAACRALQATRCEGSISGYHGLCSRWTSYSVSARNWGCNSKLWELGLWDIHLCTQFLCSLQVGVYNRIILRHFRRRRKVAELPKAQNSGAGDEGGVCKCDVSWFASVVWYSKCLSSDSGVVCATVTMTVMWLRLRMRERIWVRLLMCLWLRLRLTLRCDCDCDCDCNCDCDCDHDCDTVTVMWLWLRHCGS